MVEKMPIRSATFLLVAGFLLIFSNVQKDSVNPASYGDILNSPKENWLTYGGDYLSQRYSPLSQINRENISRLELRWKFKVGASENTRGTPLVHDGIMYATNANGMFAIDAVNGKQLWHREISDKKVNGLNRGVALLDNEVFFVTGDCKLTALDKITGELLWQNKYTNGAGYYCTLAPLALKDRIMVGVSIGERDKARGFVAALNAKNGKELWRFWTTPSPGEPVSETWGGLNPEEGGAATWVSGSYDPESNTVYWTTGSPLPNFEGEKKRPGDNLYSNCLLALDADTGKLKWYFQFTPHDMHHWDSNEVAVLVNEVWANKERKLVLQANRNGFFYVLDRTDGKFLFGEQFVKKLSWARGLDQNGRPVVMTGTKSQQIGKIGDCPSLFGATNWMSPSYNPKTQLFYAVAVEGCEQEASRSYIKAINFYSGQIKWEYQLNGTQFITAGIVSTGGGLVFTADKDKNFIALDADTGRSLWQYLLEHYVFASPISYAVNGAQYVAVSAGETIYVFSLP